MTAAVQEAPAEKATVDDDDELVHIVCWEETDWTLCGQYMPGDHRFVESWSDDQSCVVCMELNRHHDICDDLGHCVFRTLR